jgi:formate hydrogenlyase transcriptional activator
MRLHFWEGSTLIPNLTELPVDDSASGWVWQNQQSVVVPDVHSETNAHPIVKLLKDKGIRSYCTLPLTTAQKRLGVLALGSSQVAAYNERDLRLLSRVAELAALAVENALIRSALQQEKERLHMLLQVNTTLISNLDLEQVFPAISGFIRRVIGQDFASVAIYDEATHCLHKYVLDFPQDKGLIGADAMVPLSEAPSGRAFLEREIKFLNAADMMTFHSSFVGPLLGHGIQSMCCIPLVTPKGALGTLDLASTEENAFVPEDTGFLNQVAAQVAVALDNARAYREIAELKDKLAKEKLYLEDEIRFERNFEEIVGESPALRRVLNQAKSVAPSDATVLILGGTGTGKELAARAIHRMSLRKDGSFIKLNCAAIPTGLLESELFGHEKGAFTGAISHKIGRLELADRGTLFLDEVGDIPLELKPKLLRVLQDQEFERLGGTRTICVDVRLVAATNRNLVKSVAEREFRSDLYYRLHVFPIRMPALRERKTDIPQLVRYFVHKFVRRMNKQIETIPRETMAALVSWEWPGNVRELENFIERSVILSEGSLLNVPLAELRPPAHETPVSDSTLESLERYHIVRVLCETSGVIAGPRGAAVRLGLKRTTLQSKIQKMGISREEYEDASQFLR